MVFSFDKVVSVQLNMIRKISIEYKIGDEIKLSQKNLLVSGLLTNQEEIG